MNADQIKQFESDALSRPDLFPEEFVSWLRRFVSDNTLISINGVAQNDGPWITIGTTGVDGVDALLALNPPPYNTGNTPGPIPFTTPWTNVGGGAQVLSFRQLANGDIQIRGAITGNESTPGSTVFTLPLQFRKTKTERVFSSVASDGSGIAPLLITPSTGVVSYVGEVTGAVGPVGPAGTNGTSSTTYNGSGVPSSGLGSNGDYYINIANGDLYTKSAGSWGSPIASLKGPTGSAGSNGTNGSAGPTGSAGGPITISYTFSTTTTDSDPGNGALRLDNATQNAATTIRSDLLDSNGTDWTTVLDSLSGSTNVIKGHIRLFKASDLSKWIVFTLSATATPSGYRNLSVAVIGSSASSPFSNADVLMFCFERAGDTGAVGATGAAGGAGSPVLFNFYATR